MPSSTKPMHDTERLSFEGAVDADGHILEPADLWEQYIDPEYKDRALRIVLDADGLEELEIGGKRSLMSVKGFPSTLGAMGDPEIGRIRKDPNRTYMGEAPFGSMDPQERLKVLDAEGLDAVVLYTTIGLLWEAELEDPELTQAYCTAYNRWITEFCSESPRLVAAAHLSLTDPGAAAKEAERAVADGARGVFVAPFVHGRKPIGHSDNDAVFAACQDLDVPFAIHPTFQPAWCNPGRFAPEYGRDLMLYGSVTAGDGVRHQFTTLFDYGVFDKFPTLKVIVLESGGGWIGYWLDRIDAVYGHTAMGTRVPLKDKPSDYFRERCWISCDPDERSIAPLADRYGDRFMWASDFPHADHTPDYIPDLEEMADGFPESRRRAFLGDACRDLFKIGKDVTRNG